MSHTSVFLEPGPRTAPNQLAITLLARDNLQPITLQQSQSAVDGYAEGTTFNTRFGSFPHSTLLDVPWGSQVRASQVDTGSRGRKRKIAEAASEGGDTPRSSVGGEEDTTRRKDAVQAASGFIHILRPSPELWTSSLPHRTQVVYTPDYSYILHRIRARPGSRLIEAGSGSGSFTHASVRAVYNGLPSDAQPDKGRVFSFEYHEPRFEKMKEEVTDHKLQGLVQVTHRDVYQGGFLVDGKSPRATAIFLDVPAPWNALPHLSRRRRTASDKPLADDGSADEEWVSPLDPEQAVHICTFSPCIEQVIRTVEELRKLDWVDVDMVEVCHKRLNVVRERVGIDLPNERGYNQSPADVSEALKRLRQVSQKTQAFNLAQSVRRGLSDSAPSTTEMPPPTGEEGPNAEDETMEERGGGEEQEEGSGEEVEPWMKGRIVHRSEAELKTHTSYLVFATLPPEWSEEDEAAALARWPCGQEGKVIGSMDKHARKQEKREMMEGKRSQKKRQKIQALAMGQTS